MSEAVDTELLRDQVQKIVKRYPLQHEGPRYLAFHGSCDAPKISTDDYGDFLVKSVGSELELRRSLPRRHEENESIVFLLGWEPETLPLDLAGRFLRRDAKIYQINRESKLKALFAKDLRYVQIERDLARSAFGRHLVAEFEPRTLLTTESRVSFATAVRLWLGAAYQLGSVSGLSLDELCVWAATNAQGPSLMEKLSTPVGAEIRKELFAFLAEKFGRAGKIVFSSWLRNVGGNLLSAVALAEAGVDERTPKKTRNALDAAVPALLTAGGELEGIEGEGLLQTLSALAEGAFREVRRSKTLAWQTRFFREAEELLDEDDLHGLRFSPRLPIAWNLGLMRLSACLQQGARTPTLAGFNETRAALRALDEHVHARVEENSALMDRATMAVRLLGWLTQRADRRYASGTHAYASTEGLALWYAQEGGYLDWARRLARADAFPEISEGVQAVLGATDKARVELDHRFARGYPGWLERRRPENPLIPIDRSISKFVAPYLRKNDARKMLVILMDGMAWAQAVELMQSLQEGTQGWCPIEWTQEAIGLDEGFFPPILAQVPSETKVSRSAFFAGKVTPPGAKVKSLDDAALFAEHQDLQPFFSKRRGPVLKTKTNGFENDGQAKRCTIRMVESEERVVGLVINAIDDHLKSGSQTSDHAWGVDNIKSLREILDAAKLAGRTVLLTSDHGHVSGDRLHHVGGRSGERGCRWRPLRSGDTVIDTYELAIESEYAWYPKGEDVKGIVLLSDDTRRYGAQAHYGEHGGASLAEMVVPTIVLAPTFSEHRSDESADDHHRIVSAPLPGWWQLQIDEVVPEPEAAGGDAVTTVTSDEKPKRKRSKSESSIDESELDYPQDVRDLLSKLSKHPMFLARATRKKERAAYLRALGFLLANPGAVGGGTLAKRLGVRAYRIGGFLSNMGGVFNIDGYDVISYDPKSKTVSFNRTLLEQGFSLD